MKNFTIPKIINFTNWGKLNELDDFSFPWEHQDSPKTVFKAYYDIDYLYFQFTAYGPKPNIYVMNNSKMEVILSERVELFFRIDSGMSPYYCLEIDPYGRVLDYKATFYRSFNRSWHWPESLNIKTKIESSFYLVEGKIKLSTLKNLKVLKNGQMQVGIFRGHCVSLIKKEAHIKWISWVDSKTKEPDFHVPSSFGQIILQSTQNNS